MQMPSEFQGILTPAQWKRIDPSGLKKEARESVMRIISDTLKQESPEKSDPEDIEEFVEFTEDLVSDLSEAPPDIDEGDLVAAEQTSDAVLEDMAEGEGEE